MSRIDIVSHETANAQQRDLLSAMRESWEWCPTSLLFWPIRRTP